jgi:hypothetical protein
MRMPGMNSNEEEPHFTDSKEEAKYWRNLAEEYSLRSVFYCVISSLSYVKRMALHGCFKTENFQGYFC